MTHRAISNTTLMPMVANEPVYLGAGDVYVAVGYVDSREWEKLKQQRVLGVFLVSLKCACCSEAWSRYCKCPGEPAVVPKV